MPFINENVVNKLKINDPFQVGRSDVDSGTSLEKGVVLPWTSDQKSSYVYFDCTIGVMLDSGIVVHRRLPQVNNVPDTLASTLSGLDDPNLDTIAGPGVNLKCKDQYADIVQRMGHARYWFRIWGQALRFGYKVPIPGIKMIGGVPAIPYDRNPQFAFNRIAPGGNFGGVPLWHAQWSLWYTTSVPPTSNDIPAADPSVHITGDTPIPAAVQVPYTAPDSNAASSAPTGTTTQAPITRGVR
jgi:hypothetical protein